MIASVHIADVGAPAALVALPRTPKPAKNPGLRSARLALAAPLTGSLRRAPDFRRLGLVAFWDDDDALDRFLAHDPLAARLGGGWQVRLTPLRAFGSWPGLPTDLPASRAVSDDGPAAVLTLGRLRFSQSVRFVRTSARAEAAVLDADGLTWTTGLGRPPFVATCSLWRSAQALSTMPTATRTRATRTRSRRSGPRTSTTRARSSGSTPTDRRGAWVVPTRSPRTGWPGSRLLRRPRPA